MLLLSAPRDTSTVASASTDAASELRAESALFACLANIEAILAPPRPPSWLLDDREFPGVPAPTVAASPVKTLILDEFWSLMNASSGYIDPKGDSSMAAALSAASVSSSIDFSTPIFATELLYLLAVGPSAAVQELWEHIRDCRLGWTVLHVVADTADLVDEAENGLLFRLTNVTKLARGLESLHEMYPALTFQKQ